MTVFVKIGIALARRIRTLNMVMIASTIPRLTGFTLISTDHHPGLTVGEYCDSAADVADR